MNAREELATGAAPAWPSLDWQSVAPADHIVHFYEEDARLIDLVGDFIASGLIQGAAGVVVATATHRALLEKALTARGIDIAKLLRTEQLVLRDASEVLTTFLVDGLPDAQRFHEEVGALVRRASERTPGRTVRVFGEVVDLLYEGGAREAALPLERLWNALAPVYPFSLLCAYPLRRFDREADGAPFLGICGEHSHVLPAITHREVSGSDEQRRKLALLEQRAQALELEVAERRKAEGDLQRRERELSDLLENALEGIHQVDAHGIVRWANKAELDLLGYAREEYVGQHVTKFHSDQDVISAILAKLHAGQDVYDQPAALICKDGSIRHVLIHSNACVENGQFLYTRCFTRDVTARVQLEQQLRDRVRELADANRHKDRFLAMLSHELRNPLSAARTAVLAAQVDADNRDRVLGVAHDQIDLLARLIDDLLDVTRINHGRIRIEKHPTRLADVVERALESTRPMIEERQHRLSLELVAREIHVDGDPARLEQVVGNLLTNAAKYTDPGGQISITLEQQSSEAVLRVQDSGIGIAGDQLDRIFEPFVQVDREGVHHSRGLGIGLTVVREIVELHGGRVEVTSEGPGTGTEVLVYLPALAGVVTPPQDAQEIDLAASSIRILVVDDHAGAAEALTLLLRSFGHEVEFAQDGLAALEAAQRLKPNLMLVDIGLPGIDGYEVARRARAHPELRHAVLVALTGYGQPSDRQHAMQAGFDHHMTKPLQVGQLEELLKLFQRADTGSR